MTTTLVSTSRIAPRTLIRLPPGLSTPAPVPAYFDYDLIAGLGTRQIESMTRAELVQAIRAGGLHFLSPHLVAQLEHHEMQILRRLAHLANYACRRRMASHPH